MHFVMFWDRILQIPERRATATNNQELPRTFRNLAIEIALLQFALLHNASSCNKRMHQNAELQNEGAAVLAPLGAFGFYTTLPFEQAHPEITPEHV